jgi:hypothetical protein
VSAVQTETFRQLRAALDKGEKVIIPEFGIFSLKDATAEDGTPKKVMRFRDKSGPESAEKKAARKEKKAAEKAEAPAGDDED